MSLTPETLLRQWQMLRLIPRYPRKIAAADLCSQLADNGYKVGKRTIERDLQSFSQVFPLVSDERNKPYGWSWQQDAPAFDLPGLTTTQAVTLLLAREHLRTLLPRSSLDQLQTHFALAEKTLDSLPNHVGIATWLDKIRVIPSTQPLLAPAVNGSVQAIVYEALLAGNQCEIHYQARLKTEVDQYPVHPLGIVQRGNVLYLVCCIKTYPDIRLLALHRIQDARALDVPAVVPANFTLDSYLGSGALGWFPRNAIFLEAIFSPEVSPHLAETPLAEDQKLHVLSDGRVRLTATVRETLQLRWWLQGFGDAVEVIAPMELRQTLFDTANNLIRRYLASDADRVAETAASG